jgi:oxaloacetate decarboxylase (Na+ extruding) subunit alpha
MMQNKKALGLTELVLRDAHQSLFATRLRTEDMLPIADKLDEVGFWSLETWGGATFDACIRFLGEDPWERIRRLKQAMPKTPHQMLFRGQNILGYRHYADDVVEKFVERAAVNGVDVFRVFDAMNDPRNLETAIKAVLKAGKHAQGTISYTVSPVHSIDLWLKLAKRIESMGAMSLCIKDMAGLLKPYTAYELVSKLKRTLSIPIHMQSHATTGLSTATYIKSIEAGIDNVDTAISSMSMTYGHTSTETVVAMLEDTERDTKLDLKRLQEVAAYFRNVRQKYRKFEGTLKGTDSRILVAQVPGGMLTNMENQLRQQNALDRMDEVLEEIPRVRKDLGYIALVTPTSQIVGTQAVINVMTGARYKTISKETAGVLKGEYGATPAPMNTALQERVLEGKAPLRCRPADKLEPEMARLTKELKRIAGERGFELANDEVDDVLTYALFPQIGLKFLENRNNPGAFEPAPTGKETPAGEASAPETYTVDVEGQQYVVTVTPGGEIRHLAASGQSAALASTRPPADASTLLASGGTPLAAPLAGRIVRVTVAVGERVGDGAVVVILEAMKMETEVRAPNAGQITELAVKAGDTVAVGDTLLSIAG